MNRIITLCLLLGCSLSLSLSSQTSYNFPDSGELTITDCNGILYDNGGPTGDYTNGTFSTVLLTAASGDLLSLNFLSFDLESFDYLIIYEADNLFGVPIASYNGNEPPSIGEEMILDTDSIYIYFNTDFSIPAAGFELEFDCYSPTEAPIADLLASPFTCSGTVSFSDQSINYPNAWSWDFGDGNTSDEQNPIHTYATAGTYDVSLISCNDIGCDTIAVAGAINYDPNNDVCTNQFNIPSSGSETIDACSGVVYDPAGPTGNYGEGSHGSLVIEIPGATAIELNFIEFDLSDNPQDYDQLQLYIGDYENGTTTLVEQYLGTTLPNGGETITVEGNLISLLFYADYTNSGGSGFALQYQAVGQDVVPVAAFETETASAPLASPINFTDISTGNPAFWNWDFGDGNTSSVQNPSHAFSAPGTYIVNLTVSNCQGESTATPLTITVQDAPAIDFTPSDFYFELNSGETTTGSITLSNNGIGDLIANTFTSISGSNSGFIFEYETDIFGSEFSYALVNADGNIVYESDLGAFGNTIYSDTLNGFDWSESFTLNLYDSWGDGALNFFNVYDLATGTLLTSGDFTDGSFMEVALTGPTAAGSGLWIDLVAGFETLENGESLVYDFNIDATDLNGGTYETNIIILNNDPNQSNIIIPVTLVVTGAPSASVSTENIDFGSLLVGEIATDSLTITNTGTDDLIFDINALGLSSSFTFNPLSNQTLAPGESATYDLTFAPDAVGSFGGVINITTNSDTDYVILVAGNGLAAPSVVANPASLTTELIEGEDTTLFINLSNVGDAVLDFSSDDISLAQGFSFEFTTDNWAGEFSWQIVNSMGEIVLSSGTNYYDSFTTYTEIIPALPPGESYTLQLLDSFGDGALTDFTITDVIGGQVIASGDFTGNLSQLDVDLTVPTNTFYSLSIENGSVDVAGNIDIAVDLDATGLNTGTYQLNVAFSTNDPANPIVNIPITLYVIAPVIADISSNFNFVCGNIPVQFTDASINVATSWTWDFGDGNTSTEQNPEHIYAADGIYTVSLSACNELGCDVITFANYIEVELGCYAENIPVDGTETITTCSGNLYDSGGANGDYPEGNHGVTTIAPPGATAITLVFDEFNYEEHGDFLYIYEGESFQFGTLIGSFTGNELADTTIVINSGVVTLVETTNHYVNLSGFSATFACGLPDPIPPVAGFGVPVSNACDYQGIAFDNNSDGYAQNWAWDFGDGNTSTQANPTNFYATSGTYTITLTACNEFGCDTYSETIDIFIDNDCVIADMPISGNIVIDECDGTLFDSGGANADYPNNTSGSVTISPPGASTVTLTFVSFDVENIFDEVIIYDGPDTLSPVLAVLTGDIDVDPITSTGPSITIQEMSDFTITNPGYEINYNCTINSNRAEFTGELESVCSGMMQLYHTSQMECDAWHWDFGDGHTSNEQHPTHQFTETGDHPISLIACMGDECDTTMNMMWVDALIPEIMMPDTIVVGDTAHFHGLTENATDWYWEMNGETANHSAPSTIYTEAGVYDVHVHLSNTNVSEDCSVTRTYNLVVVEAAEEEVVSSIEQMPIGLSIYPNPTNDVLYLEWETAVNIAETQIRLLDVQGKSVWSGMWKTSLDVSELPSGFYVVEVTLSNQLPFRQQIIKK